MYRPWINRFVGVEMEMTNVGISMSQLHATVANVVTGHRVVQAVYSHNQGDVWETKTDGSCGYEVTSPKLLLNDEGDNEDLGRVCNALKSSLNVRVNSNCGLHIHVDISDFNVDDVRRLIAMWARYEPFFYEMLPESRHVNSFCSPIRKTKWENPNVREWTHNRNCMMSTDRYVLRDLGNGDRYRSLNLTNFWSRGTVEFRLHSGTVDYTKIKMWAKLMLSFVARVKNSGTIFPKLSIDADDTRTKPHSTYYVLKMMGLIRSKFVTEVPASNKSIVDYVDARRKLFANIRNGSRVNNSGSRSLRVASLEDAETGRSDNY